MRHGGGRKIGDQRSGEEMIGIKCKSCDECVVDCNHALTMARGRQLIK